MEVSPISTVLTELSKGATATNYLNQCPPPSGEIKSATVYARKKFTDFYENSSSVTSAGKSPRPPTMRSRGTPSHAANLDARWPKAIHPWQGSRCLPVRLLYLFRISCDHGRRQPFELELAFAVPGAKPVSVPMATTDVRANRLAAGFSISTFFGTP